MNKVIARVAGAAGYVAEVAWLAAVLWLVCMLAWLPASKVRGRVEP